MAFIPENNVISGIDPDGNEVQIRVDSSGRIQLSPLVLSTPSGDEVALKVNDDGELLVDNDQMIELLGFLLRQVKKSNIHLEMATDERINDQDIDDDC